LSKVDYGEFEALTRHGNSMIHKNRQTCKFTCLFQELLRSLNALRKIQGANRVVITDIATMIP
jgi:hypothetical protein